MPLEALIREARRRARRRRLLYAAAIALVIVLGSPRQCGGARSGVTDCLACFGRWVGALGWNALEARVCQREERRERAVVWVMNSDGTGRRVLARDAAPPGPVAWSPDGRMLAFVGMQAGLGDVYLVNADGSGLRRLTRTRGDRFATLPVWSPDGRRIAFARLATQPRRTTIFVANVDGSGERALTRNASPFAYFVWSPDGQQLAFSAFTHEWTVCGSRDPCRERRRGRAAEPDARVGGSTGFRSGHPMAAESPSRAARLRKGTLSVMNADGTGRRTLRPAADVWGLPTWSPDGRQLAFTVSRGEVSVTPEIHVMNADGVENADWPPAPAIHAGHRTGGPSHFSAGATAPTSHPPVGATAPPASP